MTTTSRPDPLLFDLQQLVVDLALVNRNHYLAGQPRRENDIEHSFAVAMLCWAIVEKYDIRLNLETILKYALVHDFVEKYAGDVNTFASEEERQNKIEREKQALGRLSEDFGSFTPMVTTMKGYEEKVDEEALFVWTVDKMQALFMGDLDFWRPYKELEISYADFETKYADMLAKSSSYCSQIFDHLIHYCKTTYYDQASEVEPAPSEG